MKTRQIPLQQYAFLNKYLEGDNESFFEIISPQIGFVVIDFNLLEERLTSFLCQIISDRSDAKGLIITHSMSYNAKVDLLDRYAGYMNNIREKSIESHRKLIEDIKESGRLRNLVVHAEWDTVDKDGYAFVKLRSQRNDIVQEFAQLDVDSLIDIRNKIIDTYNSFDTYEEWYYDAL
ncbi:MAG: hypothetical protein KKE39_14255 [Bacteroidetes bacterium]|nr:hypothetical protein [Bacteroidota bacterium]MBU1373765.1 hypothetical protein [Bacteroidota bacterium]MBU1486159.1 hypothetical protein [Bacteroidota bacterium]MBU1761803.1 hypothetical protein [Bacteroidota bacterium]MBU2375148.1 hypothetical protein [Bacteroidota bacterium]